MPIPVNVYPVRSGARARRRSVISRGAEVRTLALIIIPILAGFAGTGFIAVSTREPDLADLKPIEIRIGKYTLLDWSKLLRGRNSSQSAPSPVSGADVQALGYMVDGRRRIRDGDWVTEFVLIPEAGNLFHPAHQFGDQMVVVRLEKNARIQFRFKALFWARGTVRTMPGDPEGQEPLYALENARAQPAGKAEIRQHFR